ncbi:hypothetical protein DIE11_34665 [Burkholderia sp. Bp9012]|nr:hypothetical protein DIE11_34665 [Burkholderia sp. Bp9012]
MPADSRIDRDGFRDRLDMLRATKQPTWTILADHPPSAAWFLRRRVCRHPAMRRPPPQRRTSRIDMSFKS